MNKQPASPGVEQITEQGQTYTAADLAAVNDPPEPGAETASPQPANRVQAVVRGFTTLAMAQAYCREGSVITEVRDVHNTTLCYVIRREDA
jgi:hypothetical protein